jgi:hypothetical protein
MLKAVCSKCGFEFTGETKEALMDRVRKDNPEL